MITNSHMRPSQGETISIGLTQCTFIIIEWLLITLKWSLIILKWLFIVLKRLIRERSNNDDFLHFNSYLVLKTNASMSFK